MRPIARLTAAATLLALAACDEPTGPDLPAACAELTTPIEWTPLGPAGADVIAVETTPLGIVAGLYKGGARLLPPGAAAWQDLGLGTFTVNDFEWLGGASPGLFAGIWATDGPPPPASIWRLSDPATRTWTAADAEYAIEFGGHDPAFVLTGTPGPDPVLYAGYSYLIRRSTDGGVTWETAEGKADVFGNRVLDIAVSPLVPGRVWAARVNPTDGSNIVMTDDGFATARYTGQGASAIAFSPTDPDVAWVAAGGVRMTRDAGATWAWSLELPHGVGDVVTNDDQLIAAGAGGFYRSCNAGVTWDTLAVPTELHGAEAIVAESPDRFLVATRGTGVWRMRIP